ncbi:hypothetical protein LINPERHAP2_LOCUS13965 [Linum perenne]
MEALYAKLYDKYTALKRRKASQSDEINKDQELKFLNFMSAAEELIQHLKDENDKLHSEVTELRTEVTSIRSWKDDECAELQKLLMEENEKSKKLSLEVERLQKLLNESCSLKNGAMLVKSGEVLNSSTRRIAGKSNTGVRTETDETTPGPSNQSLLKTRNDKLTSDEVSNCSTRMMTRKRSREARDETEGGISMSGSDGQVNKKMKESAGCSTKVSSRICNDQLPECCKTSLDKSGDAGDPTNCIFQALIEYLVGMKLSAATQSEGACISVMHQTSGYSFSLTWLKNAPGGGEEPELLYRVSTLGTFERIAPEWMRSMLMFSVGMCPIFFERLARVVKLHR